MRDETAIDYRCRQLIVACVRYRERGDNSRAMRCLDQLAALLWVRYAQWSLKQATARAEMAVLLGKVIGPEDA